MAAPFVCLVVTANADDLFRSMRLPNTLLEYFFSIISEAAPTGGTTLWHFSNTDAPTLTLDPMKFASNSYSRRESAVSDVPRVFFYTDPKQKEVMFDKGYTLYSVQVPSNKIYDLRADPLHLKTEFGNNAHEMLEHISGWERTKSGWKKNKGVQNIGGLRYSTGAFEVVVWFSPIKVTKVQTNPKAKL